jgi:signal transduction histidine kinase
MTHPTRPNGLSFSQRWFWALWLWWAVCLALLIYFWSLSFLSHTTSLLNSRRTLMISELGGLTQKFTAIERLQTVLLVSWKAEIEKGASESWPSLEKQADPFSHLAHVSLKTATPKRLEGQLPDWALQLLSERYQRLGPQVNFIRPQPPGMEIGRLSPASSLVHHPSNYCLAALPREDSSVLISLVNLDYLWGDWLEQQRTRMGLGSALSVHLKAKAVVGGSRQTEPVGLPSVDLLHLQQSWTAIQNSKNWKWQLPSLFNDDPIPFQDLEFELDNSDLVAEQQRLYTVILALGLVLMGTFAATIRLAGQAIEKQSQLAVARQRFTEMVSHDLRTPVAAIRLYGEILGTGLVSEPKKQQEYAEIIQREAHTLEALVNNVLQQGALSGDALQLSEFDLNSFIERQVEQYKTRSSAVQFELKLHPKLSYVMATEGALLQISSNLIDNAIKYGGEPPVVEISSITRGSMIELQISDNGSGIADREKSKVFEPYYRIKSAATSKSGQRGVGLGLAVVKSLVEQLGARIEIRSRTPGTGTTFAVLFQATKNSDGDPNVR